MTDRDYSRLGIGAVLAAWVTTLTVYGVEADLSRDDLCYLTTLHDFLLGFEARKDYSHLGWGLLHLIGHLDLRPDAWRAGRIGAVLALVATTTVPFCAWVAYRLASAVLRDRRAAVLAAVLAAWSPAVLLGASTLGFWSRAGAAGLALLGVAKLVDSMRTGDRRGAVAAVVLQGLGLAIHPWALTVPAMVAPFLVWTAWSSETRARITAIGVLAADGALILAMLMASNQEQRVSNGLTNVTDALLFMPLVTAAHGAWQLPVVGLVMPSLPGPASAGIAGVAIAVLASVRRTRGLGLLLLGGLLASLPEATAPVPPSEWYAAWTGNFVKACAGMELLIPVVLAGLLAMAPNRGRWLGAPVMMALVVLCAGRGVGLEVEEAFVARDDAAATRTLGKALAGAASMESRLAVVDSLSPLGAASFMGKFNPEVPKRVAERVASEKGRRGGPYSGVDLALWRTSTMRCELRLGLGVDDGIVPSEPESRHSSPCQKVPETMSADEAMNRRCSLSFEDGVARFACAIGPPHAGARETLDPAAVPLGLMCLVLLCSGLAMSREGGGTSPDQPPAS